MAQNSPIRHGGNDSLFLAVEMSIIATLSDIPLHIHAEGLRGTGKTTIMRWARHQVPNIRRIKGCLYQCNPESPHCPSHLGQKAGELESEEIPVPFVEIGHGAKLGTILGSIDLGKLTDPSHPEAALMPGSIPMSHRGILFIDEINRLAETAPEITDVLLSVMGTKPGRVKIEEVGLPPCEIEVSASVWAASNPDEDPGPLEDIRRQLADRFDMVIPVQRPSDPAVVELMLKKERQAIHGQNRFFQDIAKKVDRFKSVTVPPSILTYMARLYVQNNVESMRAIEALDLASRLVAAIRGGETVTFDDLLKVIPLVLRHRVEPAVLSEILKDLEVQQRAAGAVARPVENENPNKGSQGGLKDGNTGTSQDMDGDVGQRTPSKDGQQRSEPEEPSKDRDSHSNKRTKEAELPREENSVNTFVRRGNHANQQPKEKELWYHRLFTRLSRTHATKGGIGAPSGSSATSTRGQNSPRSGRSHGNATGPSGGAARERTGTGTGSAGNDRPQKVLDPRKTPPTPPSELARRITELSWEEMLLPPDWRVREN